MYPLPREAPSRTSSERTHRDRRVVLPLLLVALLAVLILAFFNVRATLRHGAVRTRVGGSLNRASLVQMEFHTRHRRFARWGELAERGVRLPTGLRVEASRATSSHWYLRVRDVETGTTCDRIGLLTDEPGRPITPACSRSE